MKTPSSSPEAKGKSEVSEDVVKRYIDRCVRRAELKANIPGETGENAGTPPLEESAATEIRTLGINNVMFLPFHNGTRLVISGQECEIFFTLGSGGLSWVYLARLISDAASPKFVIVKDFNFYVTETGGLMRAIHNSVEVRAASSIPRTVLSSYIAFDGEFAVLNFLPGQTQYESWLGYGSVSIDEQIAELNRQMRAVLRTVDLLGRNDLCHGDLKDVNIIMTDGANAWAKFIDIDLLRRISEPGVRNNAGTQPYLSPEVIKTRLPTPSSDLYSVGMIVAHSIVPGILRSNGEDRELRPFHTSDGAVDDHREYVLEGMDHLVSHSENAGGICQVVRSFLSVDPQERMSVRSAFRCLRG